VVEVSSDRHAVEVPFYTGNDRSAPFIWGQVAIWDVIKWLPPEQRYTLNHCAVIPVPGGSSMADLARAIQVLIERHDALHTYYLAVDTELVQRVLGSGVLHIAIHKTVNGDTDDTARRISLDISSRSFDSAAELPLRLAVVVDDDVAPAVLAVVADHMALDGWSFEIVLDELRTLLADPTGATLPPLGQQPSDRAEYERSPMAARRAARALDYWRRSTWTLPPSMLATVPDPDWPTHSNWAELDSPAMADSVRRLNARTKASSAVVVMAATALLLAFYTDSGRVGLRPIVSTRFRPENQRLVAAFNQNGLFQMDIMDETADEFFHRASAVATMAYSHSEYDPRALESLVESVAIERGFAAGSYCFFNDGRFDDVRRNSPTESDSLADQLPVTDQVSVKPLDIDEIQYQSKFFLFFGGTPKNANIRLNAYPGLLAGHSSIDFLTDLDWLVGALADGDGIFNLRHFWRGRRRISSP
jgi:hypothetical protein